MQNIKIESLREKCPYLELFWSVFSRIWTEYGDTEILRISPYLVRMWKTRTRITLNTDTFNAVTKIITCNGLFV